jgi:hypothetical protein
MIHGLYNIKIYFRIIIIIIIIGIESKVEAGLVKPTEKMLLKS